MATKYMKLFQRIYDFILEREISIWFEDIQKNKYEDYHNEIFNLLIRIEKDPEEDVMIYFINKQTCDALFFQNEMFLKLNGKEILDLILGKVKEIYGRK